MGRGAAEKPRTHNLPISPRAINDALTAVVIFCFLSHVATEVADYLGGPRPGRLPAFLSLAFLPLFAPLTFSVAFPVAVLPWELARPRPGGAT